MELVIKRFGELTLEELYEILRIRVDVFVVEQACPYPEIDGKDEFSHHLYYRDADGIQAYLRVVDAGVSFEEVSIGRCSAGNGGAALPAACCARASALHRIRLARV